MTFHPTSRDSGMRYGGADNFRRAVPGESAPLIASSPACEAVHRHGPMNTLAA